MFMIVEVAPNVPTVALPPGASGKQNVSVPRLARSAIVSILPSPFIGLKYYETPSFCETPDKFKLKPG